MSSHLEDSYWSVCSVAPGEESELARLVDPGIWAFEFTADWPAGSLLSIVARLGKEEWLGCRNLRMGTKDALTLAQWDIRVPVSLYVLLSCPTVGRVALSWSATRADGYSPAIPLPELQVLSEKALSPCTSQQRPGVSCRDGETIGRFPTLWCDSCQARQQLKEAGY